MTETNAFYAKAVPGAISGHPVPADAPRCGRSGIPECIRLDKPALVQATPIAPDTLATTYPASLPLGRVSNNHDKLSAAQQATDEVIAWSRANRFVLQRNDCSRWHKLEEALRSEHIVSMKTGQILPSCTFRKDVQRFVIKHDWATALENAEGMGDDFRLPFPMCAFEFRVSGRTLLIVVDETPEDVAVICLIQAGDFWVLAAADSSSKKELGGFIWAQIRAVCIALDAGVATYTTAPAPHKLNRNRARRGRLPIRDYHVVDLARRHRSVRQATPGQSGIRVRLHFRRGHWRVLPSERRVWVSWCLVGNPDLGFIDKEFSV
jgi:hypothetical protein